MRGRHAMVSFEYPVQIAAAVEVCQSVILDNGAFSAWMQGKMHDFEGYQAWAAHWLRHPAVDWAVIPDVIDGSEEQNDRLLAQWPLPETVSVPVYHVHESLERLERLTTYPRIALGSSGQYRDIGTQRWWSRIAEVMDVLCDSQGYPRVKLHGLRMLDPVQFSHIPLSSADSCNVGRNVGLDQAWTGPYVPKSKWVRALVIMDRIEHHASSRRWARNSSGIQQNMELLG